MAYEESIFSSSVHKFVSGADGWMDGQVICMFTSMCVCIYGWMYEKCMYMCSIHIYMDTHTHIWTDKWTDHLWTDGWVDGQMDGWMTDG